MTAAIQTLWCELAIATLADAGVTTCVISPGSRSTPLVAALVADGRFVLPTIIDERAAAFFALGIARATGAPVALACTSGTAAAHYLPAIVEASEACVPLVVLTANRPPELQHCGSSQTIDQRHIYGGFVRAAFELGAPVGTELALRAVRRTMVQAVSAACGPRPGPVHVDVALRKPLEPVLPATAEELALARVVEAIRLPRSRRRETTQIRSPQRHDNEEVGDSRPISGPHLTADSDLIDQLAEAIERETDGIIVAGAMPASFTGAREHVFALAARAGYPILAEAGSQLRFARRRDDVTVIEQLDALFATRFGGAPAPRLVIQLGAEPVAAGWNAAKPLLANADRYVLCDTWHDPDGTAGSVIVGDVATTFERLAACARGRASHGADFAIAWRAADDRARAAVDAAIEAHPRSEAAVLRAAVDALPDGATLQLGNSLPIRVVDQVCTGGRDLCVITQRGAAGIDGLIASAAGATHRGAPVLLVLGDVSFAHDLGGLLATRAARAPLAIVVVDNGGGRIFGALPIAAAATRETFEQHFLTAPGIDPSAVASALGLHAVTAGSPAAVASAVGTALSGSGVTVIHAPVAATGARDVRTSALETLTAATSWFSVGATYG